jgi:hypothetical protein
MAVHIIEEEIICKNCDAEYTISYEEESVDGEPRVCVFCGADLPEEDEDDAYIEEEDSYEDG